DERMRVDRGATLVLDEVRFEEHAQTADLGAEHPEAAVDHVGQIDRVTCRREQTNLRAVGNAKVFVAIGRATAGAADRQRNRHCRQELAAGRARSPWWAAKPGMPRHGALPRGRTGRSQSSESCPGT